MFCFWVWFMFELVFVLTLGVYVIIYYYYILYYYILYYYILYIYIYYYIISYLILYSSFPSSVLFPNPHPLIHSIRVGVYCWILISPRCLCSLLIPISSLVYLSPGFWPRMFYRSGWLRCVGFNYVWCSVSGSGLCLSWCSCWR